ncbi:hypothetical protein VTO42DRAFT_4434 [Malbranchea cinnamomea]
MAGHYSNPSYRARTGKDTHHLPIEVRDWLKRKRVWHVQTVNMTQSVHGAADQPRNQVPLIRHLRGAIRLYAHPP